MKLVITGLHDQGETTLAHLLGHQYPNDVAIVPDILDLIRTDLIPTLHSSEGLKSWCHALFCFQRELESAISHSHNRPLIICDKGTLDCLEDWPDSAQSFFKELGTTLENELHRYDWVLQITGTKSKARDLNLNPHRSYKSPSLQKGNLLDPQDLWERHPKRFQVSLDQGLPACMNEVKNIINFILNESDHVEKTLIDPKKYKSP